VYFVVQETVLMCYGQILYFEADLNSVVNPGLLPDIA